jgi:hypothetical protein
MSDTLQLVVDSPNTQPTRTASTDVGYASAWSVTCRTLNLPETRQQMSDMLLQLVIDSPNTQPTETLQQMSDMLQLVVVLAKRRPAM